MYKKDFDSVSTLTAVPAQQGVKVLSVESDSNPSTAPFYRRKIVQTLCCIFALFCILLGLVLGLVFGLRAASASSSVGIQKPASSTSFSVKSANWKGWSGMKTLVTLGDSWTTTNASFALLPTAQNPLAVSPPNYWGLSGTDGPNYVYDLTAKYNQSLILTYNIASAGAVTDNNLVLPYQTAGVNSIKVQVDLVLANLASLDFSTALVSVMAGMNDVGRTYLGGPSIVAGAYFDRVTLYDQVTTQYFVQMRRLYTAGVRNFMLMNATPMDKSPIALEQGAQANLSSALNQWNTVFFSKLKTFSDTTTCVDCTVFFYDLNYYVTYLQTPSVAAGFGVSNVKLEYCPAYQALLYAPYESNSTCSSPVNDYFWLNNIHPTWPVMNEIAQDMANLLKG